ncbi:hypothetical protein L2E82_14007 [Cichorium intybus]|uniref:Uncharacterized protein n=1 Tax=Cichorium intybus TaxID=13427 RepID=A0ACB9F022_CICIN|nr:hypothetical protein L2E82_14007 [Cichorium intybus]
MIRWPLFRGITEYGYTLSEIRIASEFPISEIRIASEIPIPIGSDFRRSTSTIYNSNRFRPSVRKSEDEKKGRREVRNQKSRCTPAVL